MTDDKTQGRRNLPRRASGRSAGQRFLDSGEDRAHRLGKLRTDEEARLAAEIEKLRD